MSEVYIAAQIKITGKVQGVCFRMTAQQEAQKRNLGGWVRNCADGSVELYCAGAQGDIESLIAWCHQGPSLAHVDQVVVDYQETVTQVNGFMIRP